MNRVRTALMATALGLAGLSASAVAGPGADSYIVSLAIIDGGNVIGRPSMTLRAGSPGRISLSGAYDLTLTVEPSADAAYPLSLSTRLALPIGGEMVPGASPSFRMRLDQPVSAELASEGTARTLRVEATVSRASN